METSIIRNIIEIAITSGIVSIVGWRIVKWAIYKFSEETTAKKIRVIEHEAMLYALENVPNNDEFKRLYEKEYNRLLKKYQIEIDNKKLLK